MDLNTRKYQRDDLKPVLGGQPVNPGHLAMYRGVSA